MLLGHFVLLCQAKDMLLGFALFGGQLPRCTEFVERFEEQT